MDLQKVVTNGKYYYPANLHYGKDVCVVCDRCGHKNLIACIGYEEHDLCLSCVESMVNKLPQFSNFPPEPAPIIHRDEERRKIEIEYIPIGRDDKYRIPKNIHYSAMPRSPKPSFVLPNNREDRDPLGPSFNSNDRELYNTPKSSWTFEKSYTNDSHKDEVSKKYTGQFFVDPQENNTLGKYEKQFLFDLQRPIEAKGSYKTHGAFFSK